MTTERTRSVRPPSVVPASWGVPAGSRLSAVHDDLRRRLVLLTLTRLGIGVLLLAVTLGFGDERPIESALLGIILAIFTVSMVYAAVLARGRDLRALAVAQVGLDLIAWTAVVYVTGGPASPMSFFYALTALTAALVLGVQAARITAVIGTAIYGGVAMLWSMGIVPSRFMDPGHNQIAPAELTFQIVINVIAILLVTSLGSSLVSRLSLAGNALARSEASRAALAGLYEDVVRSIPVTLLTCTASGAIDGANPVAATLFAVPVEELIGTSIAQWLPCLPAEVFASGQLPLAGDAVLESLPGRPRVAYTAAQLYDRDGRARGGLVVVEDRSPAELMRESVVRAERLAGLGRLAAGLAHEIRNPLGAISGCVELVRESAPLSPEDRDLLGTVLREVARLNGLVTDMLAFARPRPPFFAPTDLGELVHEVARLANASSAASAAAQVEVMPGPTLHVRAKVDGSQMRQVVWNLVRNAVQASPPDATVQVSVRRLDDAIEIEVADRGPGVSREMRERVFEMFYSEQSRGTGLGLAIVKQITDAHGARIDVRPREGGGTEFVVVLPPDGLISAGDAPLR